MNRLERFVARRVFKSVRRMAIRGRKDYGLVVSVPAGHGRFQIHGDDDGCRVVLLYSANYIKPGVHKHDDMEFFDEDKSKLIPVLGINIVAPESADAWACAFSDLAGYMRTGLMPAGWE